jgi:hypothetical protein
MKNLIILAMFVTLATSAYADSSLVSYKVLKSFNTDFYDATNVKWVTTREYSKAEFLWEDEKMEVFYTLEGDLIGSTKVVAVDKLPSALKRSISKKAAGYTIVEAISFQCPDDECYYILLENEKENIILKGTKAGTLSLFKKTKK